ncbi:MAG: hypothetical protein ACAF41_31380 [Leptolyngbya sp. BL-A-14]
MTSQKDQIQALITDIDSVLQKTTPRLPWVVSGEMTQQRQILERVRNYLVNFQRRQIAGEGFEQAGARPDLLAHDIYYQPSQASYQAPPAGPSGERSQYSDQGEVAAQQMLQALIQDMGYLRSNLMQPLQSDVEALRQQREALVQEIRQLEAQRQGYAGPLPGNQQQVIAEFLQALMNRLQETLPQQVAQSLKSGNQPPLPYGGNLALSGSAPIVATSSGAPASGLGNIQTTQSQSDELLIKLDSTLSVVFESLQRNVQAYEESLSQGLSKMHSLGQQGEMMFTALISHLANQLGQEASSYLQPPTTSTLESARSVTPLTGTPSSVAPSSGAPAAQPLKTTPSQSPSNQPGIDAASRPLTLPFPGTEISKSVAATSASNVAESPSVDTAIDSWLRSAGNSEGESSVDLEIAELNLEGFDLNQLAAQDVNALLELDANLLGTNLPPQPILAPEPLAASTPSTVAEPSSEISAEDTADIDAALKLLEQLSSELQDQPTSVADADAQIDRMLSTPLTPPETAASIPDDAKDELDEFYESLFGSQTNTAEPSTTEPSTEIPVSVEAASAVPTPAPPAPVENAAPVASTNAAVEPPIEPSLPTPAAQSLDALPAAVQPINTLPAEAQPPAATQPSTEVVAPSVSTSADPTLGWDLLAQPLAEQSAEPEIPTALLEDELLSGWDFDDADIALAAPETAPVEDDPLGLGETAASGDRAPSLLDTTAPLSDSSPSSTVATPPDEPQSLLTDIASEPATLEVPAATEEVPAATEAAPLQDEISTLNDLFDDVVPSEAEAASIAASPATPAPAPVAPSADVVPPILPVVTPTQSTQAELRDDRVPDDRYTPASPEEDLLPLQAPVDEPDPELWLDESTLSRLSEDLFSLEESITDPSILSYGTEPDGEAPALFSETADVAEAEPAPANELIPLDDSRLDNSRLDDSMALEDWSSSLDAVADAPPSIESTQAPSATERGTTTGEPPEVFILEGMDDLFADTPVAPPVTPASPPSADQAEPSSAFSLEGMNSLFADPLTSSAPTPSTAPPSGQPLPFTLEGMDDLFGDVPVVTPASAPSTPVPTSQPLPFTLEGVDSLFADVPPVPDAPSVTDTLAKTDTLSTAAEETTQPPTPESPEPVSAFSFEQVGDLFVEKPIPGAPVQNISSEAVLAPLTEALPEADSVPLSSFTLEQVGNLFVEVPAGGSPVLDARSTGDAVTSSEQMTESASEPFTLEQMDDLFVESPVADASVEPSSTAPILQIPPLTEEPASSEPSALEQAFASLMGSFDEPLLPSFESEEDTQDPEKKKGMN